MARPTRSSASSEEWPAGDPALAAFAEDLRVVAGGPAPEPRPGLLAVMRQGPTVPIDSPEATGRKKMLVKTLLGSLAAKVALGAGVAAASMTAAGAAGVLPEPAQQAVASVVAAATPFQLPDPSDVTLEAVDDPTGSTSTTSSTTSTTVAGDDGDDDGSGTGGDGTTGRTINHGACVSAAARDKAESAPGSHGKTVSSIARSDCGKDAAGTTSTTTVSSSTSSTSTTVDDGERNANSGSSSGNSGRGNGGSGNGGNGNSGSGNAGNAGSGRR